MAGSSRADLIKPIEYTVVFGILEGKKTLWILVVVLEFKESLLPILLVYLQE